MCTSPLKIFNPKGDKCTYRDKIILEVPCGKCGECRKRYRQDWFVRMFFEYLHCQSEYGTTFYVTLTYNQTCLPLYNGIPVFSRENVQKFLKRLRKSVKQSLGTDCVRYFFASEYGGETSRPHHHGLIHIYYPNLSFYQISEIKHLITKAWSYHGGFVHFGRKGTWKVRGVVENTGALTYVAKYVGKDIAFDYSQDIPSEKQPFHLQSKGYGEYMIEHFGLDKNTNFAFNTLVDGSFVLGKVAQYPYAIPQYITRKVLYDYKYQYLGRFDVADEHTGEIKNKSLCKIDYVLNELGKKVKKQQEFQSIEFAVNEFNKILQNVPDLIDKLSGDDIRYILDNNVLTLRCQNIDDITDFLNRTWYSYNDTEKFHCLLYLRLFKNRVLIPNANFCLSDDNYTLHDSLMYLDEIYEYERPVYEENNPALSASLHDIRYDLAMRTYAHSLDDSRYNDYEILSQIFNEFVRVIGLHSEREELEQQLQYNNAKLGVAYVV